ncbi:MAG: DUF2127 domain-containing protein [Patescibacteria group bacterium]|nr:DUF2127 domain-containing protein [Patescibacteria group bacterium]
MSSSNSQKILHETFVIGLILKGANALLEIAVAVGLFFLTPNRFTQAVSALTARELLEDPQDKIANFLLHYSPLFSANARLFIFVYLLSHGLIKLGLVVALLKRYLWAYPLAMAMFSAFGVYQLYRYTYTHSLGLIILTAFDVLVIILAWLEYKNLRRLTGQKE